MKLVTTCAIHICFEKSNGSFLVAFSYFYLLSKYIFLSFSVVIALYDSDFKNKIVILFCFFCNFFIETVFLVQFKFYVLESSFNQFFIFRLFPQFRFFMFFPFIILVKSSPTFNVTGFSCLSLPNTLSLFLKNKSRQFFNFEKSQFFLYILRITILDSPLGFYVWQKNQYPWINVCLPHPNSSFHTYSHQQYHCSNLEKVFFCQCNHKELQVYKFEANLISWILLKKGSLPFEQNGQYFFFVLWFFGCFESTSKRQLIVASSFVADLVSKDVVSSKWKFLHIGFVSGIIHLRY